MCSSLITFQNFLIPRACATMTKHIKAITRLCTVDHLFVLLKKKKIIMSSRQGRTINVRTNFFEVKSLPDTNIYHYNVTIIPEVPPILNRRIFQRFEELHSRSDLGRIKPVYDGHKNLYTAKPLPFSSATFNVIIPEDDGAPAGRRNSRSFNVGIKEVAVIDMEELHQFLEGKGSISNNILTG